MKLLALFCAFDLAFLLEHFLGWLLARTSGGTDVIVKPTLGHGTIRSFDHLGFHGLLALFGHPGLRHGNCHRLFTTFHHGCFARPLGVLARMEGSRLIFTHHFCYFRLFGGFGLWCLHGRIISCFYHLCNATSYGTMHWVSLGLTSSHP